MCALAQKRRGKEVQNQPTAKKPIKSVSYEDFSPSLLDADTQPSDKTMEEKEFRPISSSIQSKVCEASWIDIFANRRV